MDDHETLLDLYDQLETHLQRRDRLAVYILLYGGAMMAFSSLPSRAWRVGGGMAFYITLALVVLVMGAIGLSLLVRFIINLKEIRELREEIDYFKATARHAEKPKRRVRYVVGDDGELTPVDVEIDEADMRQSRRIYL